MVKYKGKIVETSSRRRFLNIASLGITIGLTGCLSLRESGSKETTAITTKSRHVGDNDATSEQRTSVKALPQYTLEEIWNTDIEGRKLYPTANSVVAVGEKTASGISKSSGEIKWQQEPKTDEYFLAQGRGTFASDSNAIFIPALNSESGGVYALDRNTGSTLWRTNLPHRRSFIAGIHDEFGLITVNQPRRGDMTEGMIVAIERSNGQISWETKYPYKLNDAMIVGNMVFVADRESLKAVSVDANSSPQVISENSASTITLYNGNILLIDHLSCRILDGESMEILSKFEDIPNIYPFPTVSGNQIFVGTPGNDFIGIDINSESVMWHVKGDRKVTAHTMGDQLIWMVDEGGRVLGLQPSNGSIHAEEEITDLFEFEGVTNSGVVDGWHIEGGQLFAGQANSVRTFQIVEQ